MRHTFLLLHIPGRPFQCGPIDYFVPGIGLGPFPQLVAFSTRILFYTSPCRADDCVDFVLLLAPALTFSFSLLFFLFWYFWRQHFSDRAFKKVSQFRPPSFPPLRISRLVAHLTCHFFTFRPPPGGVTPPLFSMGPSWKDCNAKYSHDYALNAPPPRVLPEAFFRSPFPRPQQTKCAIIYPFSVGQSVLPFYYFSP